MYYSHIQFIHSLPEHYEGQILGRPLMQDTLLQFLQRLYKHFQYSTERCKQVQVFPAQMGIYVFRFNEICPTLLWVTSSKTFSTACRNVSENKISRKQLNPQACKCSHILTVLCSQQDWITHWNKNLKDCWF